MEGKINCNICQKQFKNIVQKNKHLRNKHLICTCKKDKIYTYTPFDEKIEQCKCMIRNEKK